MKPRPLAALDRELERLYRQSGALELHVALHVAGLDTPEVREVAERIREKYNKPLPDPTVRGEVRS